MLCTKRALICLLVQLYNKQLSDSHESRNNLSFFTVHCTQVYTEPFSSDNTGEHLMSRSKMFDGVKNNVNRGTVLVLGLSRGPHLPLS